MSPTLTLAVAVATLFVAIMVPFALAVWHISARISRLTHQSQADANTLTALAQAVGNLAAIVPNEAQRVEITKALASGINPPRAPNNPFSNDEAARYNRYIQMAQTQMAQNGEHFDERQVRDFNYLIERYRQDNPKELTLSSCHRPQDRQVFAGGENFDFHHQIPEPVSQFQ